jgi:hypothetical protein
MESKCLGEDLSKLLGLIGRLFDSILLAQNFMIALLAMKIMVAMFTMLIAKN